MLTSERHVVDLAPDAVAALGLAAPGGEPYDVLVLDRMLPTSTASSSCACSAAAASRRRR